MIVQEEESEFFLEGGVGDILSEVGWESVPCGCVLFCEVVCCVFRLLRERVFVGVWDEEVLVKGVSCGVVMDVGR